MGDVAAVGAGSSRILLILAVCALASACGPPPPPPPQPSLAYSGGHGDVKVIADDGTGPKPDQASGAANGGVGNTVSKKVVKGATNAEGTVSSWESINANFTLSKNAAPAAKTPKASSENVATTDAALKGNQDRTLAGDLKTKITANVHGGHNVQVVVTLKVETAAGAGVGTATTQTYSLSENAADNTKLDIKDKSGAVVMTVNQGAATDMTPVPFSFTLAHATPGPANFKFTYTLNASGEAEVASDLKAEGKVEVK